MKPFYFVKISTLTFLLPLVMLMKSHAQTLQLVKDINTTSSSNSYPFDFNVVNDTLFFIAEGNSNSYGLWITTGTAASTQMVSPDTGQVNSLGDIIPFKNKVYFQYSTGNNNYELWESNGTIAGTHLFDDIYPGNTGSYPSAFTVANNKLFFMANDINGTNRLYASDGTVGGTIVVKNYYVSLFNGLNDFAVLGNDIYFTSDNGSGVGEGLWKSDGTVAGTVLVHADIASGAPGNVAVYNNKLYFSAADATHGTELWVTDGTTAGTHIVVNLYTGDGGGIFYNGSPYGLIVYKNLLYFGGLDSAHGNELFVTDGTAGGTHVVKDIVPGPGSSYPSVNNMVYNGMLYFSAGGDSAGLYKTDGTAAGTVAVKQGIFNAEFPAINDGLLYVIANNDYQLFQTDGSMAGTVPIHFTNTSVETSSLSHDFRFQLYNGFLYLCASNPDITVGYELCRIAAGVLPVQLISFTGKSNGEQDVLSWSTANEVNIAGYTIQKSSDGKTFTDAGKVNTAGNNVANGIYNFPYAVAANPSGYYRLEMTDNDGKITFSKVIQLQRTGAHALAAFYNASVKQVTITNNSKAVCYWKLLAFNGSLIKQGNSSDAIINVSTSGIAAGTYIISCKAQNENVNKSMVIY